MPRLPALAGGALLLPLLALAPASPAAAEVPLGCPAPLEWQVVDLVNAERTSRGLPPVAMDVRLLEAAQLHSLDMAEGDFASHTGSDGSGPVERVEAAGYTGWNGLGENVAAGYAGAASVVAAWMASPGHRANILNAAYDHIGVGHAYAAGTRYGDYWTQDFGSASFPAHAPADVCPACANGVDDDGDGATDHPADVGCRDALAATESPACSDGVNNDPGEDAFIDFDGGAAAGLPPALRTAPDLQCVVAGELVPWKDREARPACGLGFELVLLLPLLDRLRRARRG